MNTYIPLVESFPYEKERQKAEKLLKYGEHMPKNIEDVMRVCVKDGIGFILSRNVKVFSCRDARNNRSRLGHIGIPLFDELKSIMFKGIDSSGYDKIVLAHCRGNMCVNTDALADACSFIGTPYIMEEEELKYRFGMEFGTVTPFIVNARFSEIITQVFDISLLEPISKYPGTMMTNAGNHTFGIEFDPVQLITATKNKIVKDIAQVDSELHMHELPNCINPRTIGIITGNGPESGIALWSGINSHFADVLGTHFLGDISLPDVTVMSLRSMGLSMELDKRDSATWARLSDAVKRLTGDKNGPEILALACHTTHYYAEQIEEICFSNGKKFVSMADVVIEHIYRLGISEISILGIDFVADITSRNNYSAYSKLSNISIEILPSDTMEQFRAIGYAVKKMGDRQAAFQRFVSLVRREIRAPNVLIALTELSILYASQFKKRDKNINIIDSLELYAKAIATESMSKI